jgi:hypothetical protein
MIPDEKKKPLRVWVPELNLTYSICTPETPMPKEESSGYWEHQNGFQTGDWDGQATMKCADCGHTWKQVKK